MDFRDVMGSSEGKEAPLARQLSIYSLTFDEFQSTLGVPEKDFGSMNMDEFLRNVWTAEESQAMASALPAAADSAVGAGQPSSAGLQRQGSLTLPRTLSQKTVDEVWRDLLRESETMPQQPQQQQRQPTLKEMTLEEFLVRAGVVREEIQQPQQSVTVQRPVITHNNNGNSMFFGELPNSNNAHHPLDIGFNQTMNRSATTAMTPRPYPVPLQVGGNVDLGNQQGMIGMGNGLVSGIVGGTVATIGSPDGLGKGNGDLSSLSPVPFSFVSGLRGRKSGTVEKVVERRQRRMIKNRESAARSRARKQAYTMELEAEVAKLKEQNEELEKKQMEIMERQKKQLMEMLDQQCGPKKLCLRRTQTGLW